MHAVEAVQAALRSHADPERAHWMGRCVRAYPGGYGEGDRLTGVRVPDQRRIANQHAGALGIEGAAELLASEWHEERLTGLLVLVRLFQRGDEPARERIHRLYLATTAQVNSWDLVDATAPHLVGAWLEHRDRGLLDELAASPLLWERRIAMVATQHFIRRDDHADALRIAATLLGDSHDLIHKATGWMLREVGKRDEPALLAFLDRHAAAMPRTALRYAIERLPEDRRRAWLTTA